MMFGSVVVTHTSCFNITLVMVEDMYFVQYLHRLPDNDLYGLHYGVITVKLLIKGNLSSM